MQDRLARDYAVRQEDLERQKRDLAQSQINLEQEFKKENVRWREDVERQQKEWLAASVLEEDFRQKAVRLRSDFEQERSMEAGARPAGPDLSRGKKQRQARSWRPNGAA